MQRKGSQSSQPYRFFRISYGNSPMNTKYGNETYHTENDPVYLGHTATRVTIFAGKSVKHFMFHGFPNENCVSRISQRKL